MWFVANCSSMLSLEIMNGVAMSPALLLTTKKTSYIFGFHAIFSIYASEKCTKCKATNLSRLKSYLYTDIYMQNTQGNIYI